jgi:hypothetical protein
MTTFYVYRDYDVETRPTRAPSSKAISRHVWEFWMGSGPEIYLDGYRVEERPSPRHRWRTTTVLYNRLKPRVAYSPDDRRVPLPEDVVIDVLEQAKALLTVKRWSER